MKKWWLIIALLTALVAIAILWLFLPEPQIGPANYRRIEEGMTPEQVEQIIGMPPGNYYTGPLGVGNKSRGPFHIAREVRGRTDQPERPRGRVLKWCGDRYAIYVVFDESNNAFIWELSDLFPAARGPNIFQRFARRLGW